MKKIQRYELIYINFKWAFMALAFAYDMFSYSIKKPFANSCTNLTIDIVFFAFCFAITYPKISLVKKGLIEENKYLFILRTLEMLIISFVVVYIDMGLWVSFIIIFPVLITSLSKGGKIALGLVGYSFIILNLMIFSRSVLLKTPVEDILDGNLLVGYVILFLYFAVLALFAFLCGRIYDETSENEQENTALLEQLGEKYEQLAIAQDEIKFQYEKLKDANIKLEDTNKKLTSSIAEFYTLQQISQAISSILDIKELLKYVNDIILGVMGVNNSTIILYDDKRNKLKVHTTNIKDNDDLVSINDNINCGMLMEVIESGKPLIENFVEPSDFNFTQGRQVNSFICVPFGTKSRKYGLVLIEHKHFNAFDFENVRLLDIIGQQVGIALENAELYQKMHELATIDGLTGVYNRLYFHERIQTEFKNAQGNKYELSLAIFDIDHFKKFNDTYGHLFGDKVIKKIAEIVSESLRSTDLIARFGGEEFVILFPRTSIQEANEKVEMLRQKISKTQIKDKLISASVTVSFGVSSCPNYAESENELLRTADDALYRAKESGRNCVVTANALNTYSDDVYQKEKDMQINLFEVN